MRDNCSVNAIATPIQPLFFTLGFFIYSAASIKVDETAREIAGFPASERGFSEIDLQRALDPRSNVALRANTGRACACGDGVHDQGEARSG